MKKLLSLALALVALAFFGGLGVAQQETNQAQQKPGAAPRVGQGPEMKPAPDFRRIGREFQTLSTDVQALIGKLASDPASRKRLEAAASARDYRAGEEVLRTLVPARYEVHVLGGEAAGRIRIRICFKWNPEVNVSIEW